jgi:hypothetical protein
MGQLTVGDASTLARAAFSTSRHLPVIITER